MTVYVYLIKSGRHIKIGHSKNPEMRMNNMQTGSPHYLELVAKMPFPSRQAAHGYEKMLHTRLKKHHFRGEWFDSRGAQLAMKERHEVGKQQDDRWEQECKLLTNQQETDEMEILSSSPI